MSDKDPTEIPQERRAENNAVLEMIRMLQVSVDNLKPTLAETLAQAFPNGDHVTHRKYHENLIKKAEDSAAFWRMLRNELAKWGLICFTGWALYALAQAAIAWAKGLPPH